MQAEARIKSAQGRIAYMVDLIYILRAVGTV
jgi:hypothetical protein